MKQKLKRYQEQFESLISLRSSAVLTGTFILSTSLNYLFQVGSGRYLGNEKYGLLAGILSIMSITTVACSALQVQSAKALAAGLATKSDSYFDKQVRKSTRFAFVVAAGLAIFSPILSKFWNIGVLPLFIVALYVIPACWDSITAGRFQGSKNFGGLAIYSLFQAIFKSLALLVVILLNLGVTAIVILITLAAALVSAYGYRRTRISGALDLHPLEKDTRTIFAVNTLLWLMLSMDLMVARFMLTDNAGKYAAASTVAKSLLWLPSLITQVVFPHLASRKVNGNGSMNMIRKTMGITALVSVITAILIGFVGPVLVRGLYGEGFQGADTGIWQICLGILPFTLAQFLIAVHFVTEEKHLLRAMLGIAVVEFFALVNFATTVSRFAVILGLTGTVLVFLLTVMARNSQTLRQI